jgi:ribonuclease PH
MTEAGGFIELQGTGEDGDFTHDQLNAMVALAEAGIKQLLAAQEASLA